MPTRDDEWLAVLLSVLFMSTSVALYLCATHHYKEIGFAAGAIFSIGATNLIRAAFALWRNDDR